MPPFPIPPLNLNSDSSSRATNGLYGTLGSGGAGAWNVNIGHAGSNASMLPWLLLGVAAIAIVAIL